MSQAASPPPLVWIDLEMTGLYPDSCYILEIASVVTDADLNVLGEGPDLVIHQPEEVLDGMNDWCKVHHGESGLTRQVQESAISQADAERQTLEFIRQFTSAGQSPLCGNSISLDWQFLARHMPDLTTFLGDELVDVTTIKELTRRWYPATGPFKKAESHRAREDILESIAELRFYREHIMREQAG